MANFFVSYTKADQPWAEWIADTLEANGFPCIIQAWDFQPGSNFVIEMQEAARKAERTMMVLSPAYLRATFTAPEWAAAFANDPQGLQRKLVPVRVEGCKPEGLLKSIVYIDLVGLDEAAARAALLRGVVPGRAKPETVPFPSGGTPLVHGPRFPGAASTHPQAHFTPSIQKPRNLPYASLGRLFKGRESFIETLHAALSGSRDGWAAVIGKAVHGLGGVGKRA